MTSQLGAFRAPAIVCYKWFKTVSMLVVSDHSMTFIWDVCECMTTWHYNINKLNANGIMFNKGKHGQILRNEVSKVFLWRKDVDTLVHKCTYILRAHLIDFNEPYRNGKLTNFFKKVGQVPKNDCLLWLHNTP